MARFLRRTTNAGGGSTLRPPVVVTTTVALLPLGPGIRFVRTSSRDFLARPARSRLRAPVVIGPVLARPVLARLSPQRRPVVRYRLSPPTVVSAAATLPRPAVRLAPSRRSSVKPHLFAPAAIAGPFPVSYGPRVRFVRPVATRTRSLLFAPTTVTAVSAVLARPVAVTVARIRPSATVRFRAPAVVGVGITFAPVTVRLTRGRAARPLSRLNPPAVVQAPAAFVARPVTVAVVRIKVAPTVRFRTAPVVGPGVTFAPVRVQLAPSKRGRAFARLTSVPVIGAAAVFKAAAVRLARPTRTRVRSRLAAPVVVAPVLARPVLVRLVPQRRGRPSSVLRPPVIPPLARPVAATLTVTSLRRRGTRPRLAAPAVVGPVLSPPVQTSLAPQRRVTPRSRLQPPAAVGMSAVFSGPRVQLTNQRPAYAHPMMRGPVVVLVILPAFYGPTVRLARVFRVRVASRIQPPTTVGAAALGPILYGPGVRYLRTSVRDFLIRRGLGLLGRPTVVLKSTAARPIAETLVRIRPPAVQARLSRPTAVGPVLARRVVASLAPSRRAAPRYRLAPPTVVGSVLVRPVTVKLARRQNVRVRPVLHPPVIPPTAPPSLVRLTPSRHVRVRSTLAPPAVVGGGIYFRPVDVELAPSRRPVAKARLAPLAAVTSAVTFGPPRVTLAPSHRGKTASALRPPVIPPLARPVAVTLARGRAGQARPRLLPPRVVGPILATPVRVSLAPSRRARRFSLLRPPAVVGAGVTFAPLEVKLAAAIPRRSTRRTLAPPTAVSAIPFRPFFGPGIRYVRFSARDLLARQVRAGLSRIPVIGAGVVFRGIDVELAAPIPRRKTLRLLLPPKVVGAPVTFPPVAPPMRPTLAPSRRRYAQGVLRGPMVVNVTLFTAAPARVVLARPVRRRVAYRLGLPAVVAPVLAAPTAVTLAPQPHRRVRPLLPQVVYPARTYAPVRVSLTDQSRRGARYRLAAPTAVTTPVSVLRPMLVRLATSRRPVAKALLRRVVYAAKVYAPVRIALAPSRRVRPVAFLRPPVIPPLPRPTAVRIARIRPVRTRYRLAAPTAVYPFWAEPTLVTVVRLDLRRRRPLRTLSPPTVIRVAEETVIRVHLARIRPVPVRPSLKRPTVVGAGIYFRGLLIHLARTPPRSPRYRLKPPTAIITVTPGFTSGGPLPAASGSAEDVPGDAASAEDVPRGSGSAESVPGAGSSITSIEGSTGESHDTRSPLT